MTQYPRSVGTVFSQQSWLLKLAPAPRHQVARPNLMAKFLRFRQKLSRALIAGLLGFTTVGMNGCDAMYWNEQESLAQVQAKGEVIVLTTKSPLIYNKQGQTETFGIDYDLLENFSKYYDVKIKYVVLPDEDSVMRALSNGEGDIAAARLRTQPNSVGFLSSPGFEETSLSLYCRRKSQVQNIQDLKGKKLLLLNKDNYRGLSERLTQLTNNIQIHILDNTKSSEVLKNLSAGEGDCAIVESLTGDFYARYHSQIEKVSTLTDSYSLSWLLTPDNKDLLRLIQSWYRQAARNDEITRIIDRYKTYLHELDKNDITAFFKKMSSTLPHYREAFKESAAQYKLPWQLVASVAYQESHWDPEARSFTGVRGLMQLTEDTANYLGVEDRTDPHQSIWGGSKYLRYLLNQMPNEINNKERLALALAAYNIGLAHLRDAQKLAEKLGLNPHSWKHLRQVLPLLADPDYASDLEYGPARGHETVEFVDRVKSFYNLMTTATST